MLVWFSVVAVLIAWLILPLLLRMSKSTEWTPAKGINSALIVFAHPDDETMFFMPTIVMLRQAGVEIHLLCLSNGGYDGLGTVRTKEFERVAKSIGVSHVKVAVDKELSDGPHEWNPEAVGRAVSNYQSQYKTINAIFTFDAYGVSGHPNHISVYRGIHLLRSGGTLPFPVFYLRSVNIFRKYLVPLDFLITLSIEQPTVLTINKLDPFLSFRTMKLYGSQNVWFRKLFSLFSRYSYLNDYSSE